jgi:hypothetical protein
VEIVKKELPLDILEFFFLTPLPGSEDHQTLVNSGVVVDPDLNKYDLNHVCAPHPKMSREDWEKVYRKSWETYYTDEHMEAVIRRLVSKQAPASNAIMSTSSMHPSASPAKIITPIAFALCRSTSFPPIMLRIPDAWNPPIPTWIPRSRSGRARSSACGNWFDCTPVIITMPAPAFSIIRASFSGRIRVLVSSNG